MVHLGGCGEGHGPTPEPPERDSAEGESRRAGAITYSKANKWRVFRKHYTMKESPGTLFFGSLSEIPSECAAQLLDVQSMLAVDLERRGPVVEQSVPGRVLLLRPQPGSEIAGSTEGVWLSGEELKMEGILLSYEMVKVHPVAEAYLWLLNSLACAQLEGATGVAIDEVPHQKASSAASGLNRGAARLSSSTLPMHRSVSSTGGRASSSSGSLREIGLRLLDFWDPDNNDGTPWLQHGSRSLVLAPLGSRNRDPPMTTLEETETPQE
uniref:Alpha beta-hydrolase n=1 Tax=Tetraselmis sp. GSL018 TaxID=582737 RepID=A0A061SF92_9CHLO